jgi:putative ABC transport system ATP-binding protein
MAGDPIVVARDLRKRYGSDKNTRAALDGVSLDVDRGEFVAVLGPSGCGKSTLLGIIGGLDRSYQGELQLFGRETRAMNDRDLAALRAGRIGFVFQAFHLLGHLNALDNVLAPSLFAPDGGSPAARAKHRERAEQLLEELGLGGRGGEMPSHMSGGERQRLAIARAMLLGPELLLCDEPTGNLDEVTGNQIVDIFSRLHGGGLTLVAVTHEERLADAATRIVRLHAGKMLEPEAASEPKPDPDPKSDLDPESESDPESDPESEPETEVA